MIQTRNERLLSIQNKTLQAIALGQEISEILNQLIYDIQSESIDGVCSILLFNAESKTLHFGYAPDLPKEYIQVIDGVKIGENTGSCGSAVFRKTTMQTSDIATDPLWVGYREAPLSFGLRACTSVPVIGKSGIPLAVFALYYRTPKTPDAYVLKLLETASYLASVALEKKLAEEKTAKTSSELMRVANTIPGAVFKYQIMDSRTHGFTFISPGIKTLTGLTPEEVLEDATKPWLAVHSDDRSQVLRSMIDAADDFRPWNKEFRVRDKNGTTKWLHAVATPYLAADGKTIECHGVFTDITKHKCIEEGLRQSHKMESIGRLAGGIAHDFNNLLFVISGQLELLQEELNPEHPAHRHAKKISEACSTAGDLVKKLMRFSRGQTHPSREISVNEIISQSLSLLQTILGQEIELKIQACEKKQTIWADSNQLIQILLNLTVNAKDAMKNGGTLKIELGETQFKSKIPQTFPALTAGEYALLTLTDSGVGMNDEVLSHLFEPFYTTKEVGQGSGLGLAIVFSIVQQLGGGIRVQSKPGEGSRFDVYLPKNVRPHSKQALLPRSFPLDERPANSLPVD